MAQIQGDNPFAGLQFASGSGLSTKAEDLNFQAGTVAAAGGIIKTYQDTQESNKLANFNNAIRDMEMKGDVAGLKQLTTYSDQFRDAAVKEKAFTAATGAFDNTASTLLLNEAGQHKQAGDLSAYQGVIEKAQTAGLSPKTLGAVQTTLNAAIPDLTVASTIKQATAADAADMSAQLERNQLASEKAFGVGASQYSPHFDLVKGELVEKPLNLDALREQIKVSNVGKTTTPESLKAQEDTALLKIQQQKDLLQKQFAIDALKAGAAPIVSKADKTAKDVVNQLLAANIPAEKAVAAGQVVTALRTQSKALGAEAQARLAVEVNPINVQAASKLDALKQKFAITQKLSDSEIDSYIKQRNSTPDDFFKAIEAVDPKGNILDLTTSNREQTLKVLTPLIGQKITVKDSDGKEVTRTPTWAELGNAVRLAQDMPWWSSERKTVDDTKLIPLLKQAMATNNAYNKVPATEGAFKEITDYVKESLDVKTKATADILRITQRVNAQEGVGDYSISNKRLEAAAAALTQASSPTPVDPVQATKKKLFDTSQAVTSSAEANNYLTTGKERIASLASKLTNSGLDKAQTAGIIGALQAESGNNLDPSSHNKEGGGRGARGISQWRGDRITALEKFAGKPVENISFDEQTNFLIKELKSRGDFEKIKAAKTPGEAAVLFEKLSLRAGVGAAHGVRRKNADNVYASLNS